ncbi:MAG: hypothetical protein LBS90_01280 [Oscillospiraceae bacterium]|jgi:hypothetical protein|nr:hypothetical protein [Oscillospiraceae bacterium]
MGRYKNFKSVLFCTAPNMINLTEKQLRRQLDWFNTYVGVDKVYLEPYRDGTLIPEEQLEMLIRVFKDCGVEVSGALTTTCNDLTPEHKEKVRFSGTYCYVNKEMRDYLVTTVEYTARHFDEFILDDWFFTYCTCDECRAAKGGRSWEDFRTELLAEVSENLIVKPAKAVNPNVKVIIKYPNWSEAYQESGYNPDTQRHIFDKIYTGTETRDTANNDQHLPRYMSYSLVRLMENYAPGRNGGAWFDPYGCSPLEIFLEQGYLSAFARAQELTLFCWGSLYKNRVVTPLGLQLGQIDAFLSQAGKPIGTPAYLPASAQGEDHIEDFLGMAGIPLELTPDFPEGGKSVFLTVQALRDPDIYKKIESFVVRGGKVIVTSGFMTEALARGVGIEEITSIRYLGRKFRTREFRGGGIGGGNAGESRHELTFPLLEHRNNTTWTLAKAVVGEENYPLILRDTYGKGQLITIVVPDEYGYIYDLPAGILASYREQFTDAVPYSLTGPAQASLFAYDNDTFAIYKYVDKLTDGAYGISVAGNAESIEPVGGGMPLMRTGGGFGASEFRVFMLGAGDFGFYKINWAAERFAPPREFFAASAPNDAVADDD